ncbi:rhomboid family intramembrane serine protease [Yinghuangia sp. KLBMP8922]|uniref:Rhomboid family intramembrane serine protease n=2 Tax=Yinghuangia soli TaxID=2908204 RepID=A0AA41PV27_9ACTN|nr:rhomboid family intramembrane serine protease [Yinghuangia soli]MCF2526405.1 rhomboid family intramembrane serine protease [Yinghuangia soli]
MHGDGPAGSPQGPAGPPVCYRHPGRETHIRCTRCERPVCTDCMVSASVGFQCPDCVQAGGRTVREARTIAGARVRNTDGSAGATGAVVTKTLIGLNLAVWILVLVVGDKVVDRFILLGRAVVGGQWAGIAEGEWYRLFTAAFLHQEPWHILFNMFGLWMLGPPLEAMLGRVRFLTVYLVSALGGSALSYLIAAQNQGSLGASGAVFGLFGAALVVGRRMNADLRPLIALLVINLVITFLNVSRIDWRAHVGGLVVGALAAACMVHAPKNHRVAFQVLSIAGIVAVLVGIVLFRTSQLS